MRLRLRFEKRWRDVAAKKAVRGLFRVVNAEKAFRLA